MGLKTMCCHSSRQEHRDQIRKTGILSQSHRGIPIHAVDIAVAKRYRFYVCRHQQKIQCCDHTLRDIGSKEGSK